MSLTRINSVNSDTSADEYLEKRVEDLVSVVVTELVDVVLGYANKVASNEVEVTREAFFEHLKLSPCPDCTVEAKSPVTRAARGEGRTTKKKELTPEAVAMYRDISNDKWDWGWHEDRCQRFVVSGGSIYTFCGKKVSSNGYFCKTCIGMTSQSKLIQRFNEEETDPKKWFEEKTSACKKLAKQNLGQDTDVKVTAPPKKTSRGPPDSKVVSARTQSASPNIYTRRNYQGRDKPADEQWFWSKIDQKGYVFNASKELVGMAALCTQSRVTQPTEEEFAFFDSVSQKIMMGSDVPVPEKPTITRVVEKIEGDDDAREPPPPPRTRTAGAGPARPPLRRGVAKNVTSSSASSSSSSESI